MFRPKGQNQFQMTYKEENFKQVNNADRDLESKEPILIANDQQDFRNKTPYGLICCKPPDCQRKKELMSGHK